MHKIRPRRVNGKSGPTIPVGSGLVNSSVDWRPELNYPFSVLKYSATAAECNNYYRLHPNQKPVALLSYLIKTYTNEGETILDNTFGSCSTGVSCLETGRRFIGIEKDPEYFRIGEGRMRQKAMELGIQTNEAHSSYGKTDTDKSGYQLGLPQLQSQIHETV